MAKIYTTAPIFDRSPKHVCLIDNDGNLLPLPGAAGNPAQVELQPAESTESNEGGVAVTGTTGELLAANPDRLNATFTNFGTTGAFLALGPTATAGQGIYLAPNGGSYNIDVTNLYRGVVSAITASGNTNVAFHEGS